jgi:solute carrier family 34 (sodium-dependent phosphate cotransporter)
MEGGVGNDRAETADVVASENSADAIAATESALVLWSRWLIVLFLVYLLLVAVGLLSQGFRVVSGGADGAREIFAFATNPVMGVILGTLATALVQSSSAVTSVIVGLVGGGLPVGIAIPMIMGSNMGTTLTNTIVALGNMKDGPAFNRSFGAATVHDFFNLFSILIFLPLEMVFHPLERLAGYFAPLVYGSGDASIRDFNVIRQITRPAVNFLRDGIGTLPDSMSGLVMILVGVALVLLAVFLLNKMLRKVMTGRAKRMFSAAIGKGAALAIVSGLIVTILVQSSTLTTVLIVPFAGAGLFSLAQVYPFTLGANIGTPITAILSATAVIGEYQLFALQVAFVHLFYNALGVALFAAIPPLWRLPVRAAQALADGAQRTRWIAFAYIFGVFLVLPGALFGIHAMVSSSSPEVVEAIADEEKIKEIEEEVEKYDLLIE